MIIVALGLLFTGAFAGIILYKRKIKNRSREVHNPVNVPPTSLDDDDYVDANDIISFDNDIQQRKRQRLKVKFRDLHSRLNGKPDMVKRDTDIKEQVNILPYNKSRELPRNSLELGEELGSGMFGRVFKGKLLALNATYEKSTVAIKTLNGYNDEDGIDDFLDEVKIMSNVNPHLNLVSMVGACTSNLKDDGLLWLILEFCPYGDLKSYLQNNERNISNGKDYIETINSRCLIKWAYDIANGMQYLAENRIMHGDLAARNVLLDDGPVISETVPCLIAKVSDFGLSKKFYDNVKYKKSSRLMVPWRWMAPEYLNREYFTLTSDVWSFGVLIYEIMSFGESPYGQQGYEEVYEKLQKGYRLTCPKKIKKMKLSWAPKKVFEKVSQACFVDDPLDRASFTDVIEILKKFLSQEEIDHYDRLKAIYVSCHSI